MKNPIIDNRIVYSKTFAVRFKSFIGKVETCDPMSEEEKKYLYHVAQQLLDYQLSTVTNEDEIKYFKNLNLL